MERRATKNKGREIYKDFNKGIRGDGENSAEGITNTTAKYGEKGPRPIRGIRPEKNSESEKRRALGRGGGMYNAARER